MTLVGLVDLVDPETPKKSKVEELGNHNPVRLPPYFRFDVCGQEGETFILVCNTDVRPQYNDIFL